MSELLPQDLILIDKPYGVTPLEAIEALRRLGIVSEQEKATYAGRLDPLATGLMLILKEEGVHQKEMYLGLPKTYEIEITFGVSTDTGDVLGLPKSTQGAAKLVPSIEQVVALLESTKEITYPAFSSKTVDGIALHEHTRAQSEIERPLRAASFHVTHSSTSSRSGKEIVDLAQNACAMVKGNFRQQQIAHAWNALNLPQELTSYTLTIDASSGTYMRAIPELLESTFGVASVITKIHRTKVGEFTLANAIHL